MLIKAEQKYIRMSPRKVRLIAEGLRGQSALSAKATLERMNKYAATPMRKTLTQAIANAVNNHGLKEEVLEIKSIQVGEGATFKRWQPVSRGRAHAILKRTSHIRIILESQDEAKTTPESKKVKRALPHKSQAPSTKKIQMSKSKKIK